MYRLSIGVVTPKESVSIYELWRSMTGGPLTSTYIFPDTGFVTTEIHHQFWDLGDVAYVFPQIIASELSGWAQKPLHNDYLHSWLPRALRACAISDNKNGPMRRASVLGAIGSKLSPFNVGVLEKAEMAEFGYDYYVELLSLRKRLGLHIANELALELGHSPTESELRKRLTRDYHPRVIPIALEGWAKAGVRNYVADEEMVVSAVITAIATGEPTLILTRDTDVFDQFLKLYQLINADYTCFRFGEVRAADPDRTPMYEIPVEYMNRLGFVGDIAEHVVISQDDVENLLPYEHTPVHCFCVLVGNHSLDPRISIAGYCLETEIETLLKVKGRSGGKNTERFGSKNIAAGTGMNNGSVSTLFTLAEDEMVDYEGVKVSCIDLQQVFNDDPLLARHFKMG